MANILKVLVVEDNVINQKVVVKMLERMQLQPTVAVNGKEAMQMFSMQPYDLVFMDIQMPEMDGLEATRAIRSMEKPGAHAVIIALTANAMQGDRERCLQSGMDDYLAKPIKQVDIETIIDKWLEKLPAGSFQSVNEKAEAPQTIIDPARIQQINDIGDSELLKELMKLYLDDLDQFSTSIVEAMKSGNHQQIYESAHKLKGSSANLGINSLRESCLSMEAFAKQNDHTGIADQFAKMEQTMKDVRSYITTTYL